MGSSEMRGGVTETYVAHEVDNFDEPKNTKWYGIYRYSYLKGNTKKSVKATVKSNP